MNVTILVPPVLRAAMEGRTQVELGVPPSAGVGELVQTLLTLYPGLGGYVPGDGARTPRHLALGLSERSLCDLALRRSGLKEGQVVYLFASAGERPSTGSWMHGRG